MSSGSGNGGCIQRQMSRDDDEDEQSPERAVQIVEGFLSRSALLIRDNDVEWHGGQN
jgi:hypothetical protein